ncbi:MAG: serine--tRNA ligase, partial [Candidatus Omnitrophota bacterium]|nr:serine--tRNA ligase [Candidatus Omnitrophota bacterium]
MLELKFIRENVDKVKKSLKDRNSQLNIDELLKLDVERRNTLKDLENFKYKKNTLSQEIGQKIAKKEDVSQLKSEIKTLS